MAAAAVEDKKAWSSTWWGYGGFPYGYGDSKMQQTSADDLWLIIYIYYIVRHI